jgi:hypothetical protein
MDNLGLGGATFKVVADASLFVKGVEDAEKKAASSSKVIETSVKGATDAYGRYSQAIDLVATKQEIEQERAVRNAVAQTRMRQILDETSTAQAKVTTTAQAAGQAIASVGQAGATGSRGLLQAAYAVDDLQYGFRSIVNNIPQMLMFLGPGIAGAAGVAAVGISQLINHWGELTDVFKSTFSDLPIAALAETRKRADEAAEAFERLKNAQTKAGSAEQAGISDVLTEGPLDKHVADLAGAIAGDALLGAARGKARPRGATAPGVIPMAEEDQRDLDAKKVEADRKTAERLLGQAVSKDPAARAAAISEIGRLNPELGKQLEEQSPEAQAKRKADQEDRKEARAWKEDIWKIEHDEAKEDREWEHWESEKFQKEKMRGLQDEKTKRIQGLNDQQMAIQRGLHDEQEKIWQQQHAQHAPEILGSARAAIDMYQKAIGGVDSPREIAKKSHDLQEAANKKLQVIADEIKKQQRVVLRQ